MNLEGNHKQGHNTKTTINLVTNFILLWGFYMRSTKQEKKSVVTMYIREMSRDWIFTA